jgi:hypothetical protein
MPQADGSKRYPGMTSATRAWMLVPLCAALACGASVAGAPAPGVDSGSSVDAGTAALETGTIPSPGTDGSKNAAGEGGGGKTGIDAAAPVAEMCLLEGVECTDGGIQCCNSDCMSGACGGCLGEGETGCLAGKACCSGLSCTSDGFCGTTACVWEGHACGGDGGAVCCNDDCNPHGVCGPF